MKEILFQINTIPNFDFNTIIFPINMCVRERERERERERKKEKEREREIHSFIVGLILTIRQPVLDCFMPVGGGSRESCLL